MKIAYQGEPGAYSEAAGKNLFGIKNNFMPFEYFEDVFAAVKTNKVDRGVVPIENSLAGSIHQNYDLLQKFRLKIIKETHLRVEHVLMCHKSTSFKNISEVRSHPQALAQCNLFFTKKKNIRQQAWYDTAGAAKYLTQHQPPDIAAIASIYAARLYKLKVLKRNFENNHQNYTRFLGISKSDIRTGSKIPAKTSISIAPKKNQIGILYKMLEVFAIKDINLLKIESRPIPNRVFEYLFYLDFEGRTLDKNVKEALTALKKISSNLQIFGSYARGVKSVFK